MNTKVNNTTSFQELLQKELNSYVEEQAQRFPKHEVLTIDLHCHDRNSNVPDELLGRILNVPETWHPTRTLYNTLKRNGADVITITNHNNADSCWELIDNGHDILVGSEFSVKVPDFNVGIHVLTYGFNKEQEKRLNKLRPNLYQFLQYAHIHKLPTIWAHPLYHYTSDTLPSFDFFSKMALVFERFEVLNGQRDTWQNMLVKSWLEQLTPEQIDADAERFEVDMTLYTDNPYKKSQTGGSDSHMGIFSGQTGTYLHIPNLHERLKKEKYADLALEAIRKGHMAPYGSHQNSEKLTVAFLDYVCQIAMFKEDTDLFRIMLHKGSSKDKFAALAISNAFAELRRHKVTMRFVELFHDCFMGKKPSKAKRMMIPKIYRPIFDEAINIANAYKEVGHKRTFLYAQSINSIHKQLNNILFDRLNTKVAEIKDEKDWSSQSIDEMIDKLELTSNLRELFTSTTNQDKSKNHFDINKFLDGLSFPLLASSLILGANFMSSKVLYNNRVLLNEFSDRINGLKAPKRILWLTDTFNDKNGVSTVLQSIHQYIKTHNLPIDLMVCSETIPSDDHLIVVKPVSEFKLPFYPQQSTRVPDFNQLHSIFLENEYDRIICSTEGVMGAAALFLKNAYTVHTSFYMHTDWIMFARKVLKLEGSNLSRVRRFFRAYYSAFDQVFVLNNDHSKWLLSDEMGFNKDQVKLTAHWADDFFKPVDGNREAHLGVSENEKVLLYVGRFSSEKGIYDVIDVYKQLKDKSIKMVFVGTGPDEARMKELLPEAIFLGWIPNQNLPCIFSSADLLILPSRFDTFSCTVLESFSCGLPVIAYKSKGPKDIINHNKNGYLVSGKNDMVTSIDHYFTDESLKEKMSTAALHRAQDYNKDKIMNKLLKDLNIDITKETIEAKEENEALMVATF